MAGSLNHSSTPKAAEWRAEQGAIRHQLAAHETTDRTYIDQGMQLLELAVTALNNASGLTTS